LPLPSDRGRHSGGLLPRAGEPCCKWRLTSACSGARAAGLRLLPLTPSRAPADA
jgi:hypothetical protein